MVNRIVDHELANLGVTQQQKPYLKIASVNRTTTTRAVAPQPSYARQNSRWYRCYKF